MAASTCTEAVEPLSKLEVRDLMLVRGERVVQRDLSFRVASGEMLAVGGRNGAGKTSLLRAIAGLLIPRSGSILFHLDGARTVATAEERGQFVGWIGHQDGVKAQLTPREHLRFHTSFYRSAGDIEGALARTGLTQFRDLPAQYLSAGQRRRLAFARLLLGRRPLWLFDEPLSALDAQGKDFVRQSIVRHC
ncbi:MAG TPA: heme ABC exporter ATP-binding protein CcmA, partial [Rhizomicrobium sp.]